MKANSNEDAVSIEGHEDRAAMKAMKAQDEEESHEGDAPMKAHKGHDEEGSIAAHEGDKGDDGHEGYEGIDGKGSDDEAKGSPAKKLRASRSDSRERCNVCIEFGSRYCKDERCFNGWLHV